eukprot:CAMPEP_0179354988 /NCGR_PEP_ID=MMETSP0797-20121207/77139_1 /TAXON_ID=47934 /ORGANISM="Dinophysis acuminata, Strain DAEP01" /LENGTH=127 /DNA_ID=CAMNT_0021070117 /DNA_START=475 /DNA_END=855 /DNA_ORIENTATION=+
MNSTGHGPSEAHLLWAWLTCLGTRSKDTPSLQRRLVGEDRVHVGLRLALVPEPVGPLDARVEGGRVPPVVEEVLLVEGQEDVVQEDRVLAREALQRVVDAAETWDVRVEAGEVQQPAQAGQDRHHQD